MVQDSLIRIGMNDNCLHFEEKSQCFHEIKIYTVTVLVVISLDGSCIEHHAQVSNTAHGCSYNKYISVHIYCRSLCSGYDNNILNFRTKIRPI